MNRLECIKSMVSKCKIAADIGTDHGYVPEMLLSENICEKIIATDLNKGPLSSAIEYLTSMNLSHRCDFRLGSGLQVLNENEVDAIIIAGMGGDLISDIIEANKNIAFNASQLILQPMTHVDKLRKYLHQNRFLIIDENIVKEFHHYYFIIKAVPDNSNEINLQEENEIYYEISKHLLRKSDNIFLDYINKQIDNNNKIIKNLQNTNNQQYKEKIIALTSKNKQLEELIKFEIKGHN